MKILVVGAGIAGSAAAYLLSGAGHEVEVIDEADRSHSGGYLILLDDTALRVLEQLGAADLAYGDLSIPAPEITVRWKERQITSYTPRGYRLARRGDLVGELSRLVAQAVPVVFGRELVSIEHHTDAVQAHFADGSCGSYDLIVGADGLYSTVRRLAVETDRSHIYRNGRAHLWASVPGRVADGGLGAVLADGNCTAQIFPYPDEDRTLITASVPTGARRPSVDDLTPAAAKLLETSGEQFAPFVPELTDLDPELFRITEFAQVRAPRWHARRTILVGDAAHCIDPLSGLGAHGGLLGASVLADELHRHPDDMDRAAENYRRRTNAFARPSQLITAGLLELATATDMRHRVRAAGQLAGGMASTRWYRPSAHQGARLVR